MYKLIQIFKQYKYKLSIIYMLMFFSELIIIVQPYMLGKSIDALILSNYGWVSLLGVTYILTSLFTYKQMILDTKVYTGIYNDMVFKFIKNTSIDTSVKLARTDMAKDVVNVLEGYVHYYIATIVTIIGSITFIYKSNFNVGLIVTFGCIFIAGSVMVYYKKIKQVIAVMNNHYETKVDSFYKHDTDIWSFFIRKRKLDIINSNLQGKSWLLVRLIKHCFLIASLLLLINTTDNLTTGSIITVYMYLNTFLESLMSIPVSVEMYSRLTDILRRLD